MVSGNPRSQGKPFLDKIGLPQSQARCSATTSAQKFLLKFHLSPPVFSNPWLVKSTHVLPHWCEHVLLALQFKPIGLDTQPLCLGRCLREHRVIEVHNEGERFVCGGRHRFPLFQSSYIHSSYILPSFSGKPCSHNLPFSSTPKSLEPVSQICPCSPTRVSTHVLIRFLDQCLRWKVPSECWFGADSP